MKNLINNLLEVIYPENAYCICCGDVLLHGRIHGICDSCIAKISWLSHSRYDCNKYSFDKVLSLASYDSVTKKILYDLKFNKKAYYAKYLGRLMGELLVSSGENGMITAVPMYRAKEKKRGYNQAELLALSAAHFSGSIYIKDALIKIKETDSMRLARDGKRSTLLEGSIKARGDFSGETVILVDDVITTGATADICARELKAAGAKRVIALTFCAVDYKGN